MGKNFKKIKVVYISISEMKKHLAYCRNNKVIVFGPREGKCRCREVANVELEIVNLKLTYRLDGSTTQYVCRLDGELQKQKTNGLTAYTTLSHYYKVPKLKDQKIYGYAVNRFGKVIWAISPTPQFMWFNKEKNNQRFENCFGYDMNSAFSLAMLEPIPDTTKAPRIEETTKKGEIGFRLDGSVIFEPGRFANFIFPLMESPFVKFVEVWYERKQVAKTKAQREKAKEILNYAVGYLHRTNPFIRNCIVARCNDRIKELIDENTLYSNTDSIVSAVRRPDLEANIGPYIGQWKLEHQGAFAFKDFSYQWNLEQPKYRGIPKGNFETFQEKYGRPWDLLKDPALKTNYNVYAFDLSKLDIVKRAIDDLGGEDEEI